MKKFSLLTLMLAFTMVLLAACGGNANNAASNNTAADSGETANNETTQSALEAVKASGKLRIGTEGTYAPFTFHDASGNLTGFDVDIAREVSKRLGVEPEFIETQWDGMFAGLDAKRFDVVFNQVSINEERQAKYAFSDPYIVSKAVLIVHQDNNDIKGFADLKGKKSAQSLTSNLTEIAKSNGAEIVGTEGFNQAIDLLLSKRVDATVNDGLSFLDLKTQRPDVPLKSVAEADDAAESAALFNKGNDDLVEAVNKALADMKADGTYLTISKKYFGEDVSK
ncbi:amino acid ABC transporter substrate-binding protein [Paenibacillus sp. P96]|uniref:Amino acid ABC transporter substrate-binding protein n=1 Tax=Paenibacillus zeirhizosphaerae TaxID=2987519 RepID=A0ABT9FUD6_9BACL|nr:amino acid ABC transporter substrate-binding protein [Paenibacillus sp. P96]MDP4098361.1 amino acid ABC transporter substrate-binding protein [Paenibacillus sp. P96]